MSRALPLRRTVAASAALVLTAFGATALPAAADPGQGNGQGQGHQNADKNADKKNEGKNGDKSNQGKGPKPGKGTQGDNGNGPKPGKAPQGNNGNGPKPGKAPQGDDGNGNGDPVGNNGTVKITPIGQDDGIPQNNPHVPCGFDIEWYGFDEGPDIISTVTLAMHAPTKDVVLTPGGPSEVFVGGDPASGAGTDSGFDGEATYYPTFDGEPHAQQGYHVKLTVHTPRSQGADTKHKVFWVEPCEAAPAEEDTETGGRDEDTTGEGERDTEVLGEQAVVDSEREADSERADDTEVMGAQATAARADVPNAVAAGDERDGLVATLASPLPLGLLLIGLALAGIGFVARRRTS